MARAALLAMLAAGVARAAEPSAKQLAAAAYAAGTESFQNGDFRSALESFEKAYKLDPSPVLLYNLARAYEEMGNGERAIENFQLYLARQPDAADRAEVETRIRVTLKMLERAPSTERGPAVPSALVAVASEPAGAAVFVDDVRQPGEAPLEAQATPGRHALRVELSGYAPSTREIDVQAGDRAAVSMRLVPLPGHGLSGSADAGAWQRPVAYGAFAASAVALGLSGLFYARASDAADEADGLRGEPDARGALQEDFDDAQLGMWLSVGGAALLLGAGTALLLTDSPAPAPAPSASRAGLVFAW